MKKFLVALLLVLCMAFPAAAKTWTTDANTTQDQLKTAVVASTDVDTIVIGASISLDATGQGDDSHTVTCGLYISPDRTLTLQISKGCTLTVSNNDNSVVGIYNRGTLTIKGEGHLVVNNDDADAASLGVFIDGGTTYIDGGVSISANGSKSDEDYTYGVYMFGSDSKANILSADISAAGGAPYSIGEDYGGTINIYAGKFSGEMDGNCVLGPDSTRTGTGISTDPYIVTNNATMTFNPTSLDVTQGEAITQVVSVDLLASGDVTLSTFDTLEVTPASVDGITVTPSSSDHTITFKVEETCKVGTYTFNVSCSAPNEDATKPDHAKTETFTVTVKEAGKSGSGSSGGCNAGFGALALAAVTAAFAARQRKK